MTARRAIAALTVAWLAAGCTDFPSLESGDCGNRVLEPGEDCDGASAFQSDSLCGDPDDEANACFYVCTGAARCPVGWGCGADGRCRQPSGEFAAGPGSPYTFPVSFAAAADVDGDRRDDLIGFSSESIQVLYGDASGAVVDELEAAVRTPTGPPVFGRLDGDDVDDIVVPTDLGLFVLLGSVDRALEPVAYAPFEIDTPEFSVLPIKVTPPIDGFPTLEFPLLLIVAGSPGSGLADAMFFPDQPPFELPPDTFSSIVGRVPIADLGNPGPGQTRHEWVLPVRNASSLTVFSTTGVAANPTIVAVDTVALPGPLDRGAAFGDIDGDGDQDLLVSFRQAGSSRVGIALNTGGDLAGAAVALAAFDADPDQNTWPLALGDFDGDGRADYVMPQLIVLVDNASGVPTSFRLSAFATANPWEEAVVGDFNGDGKLDIAVSTTGQSGLDVFLGNGVGFFNRFHLTTDTSPAVLRAGDFDGDFVGDIAFAGRAVTTGGQDSLFVAFGRGDGGPTDPVSMGRLDSIQHAEMFPGLGLFDSDLAADLIVVSTTSADTSSVAFMQGSSSRRMISPFALQHRPATGPDVDYTPRQVALGNFDSDDSPDIFALADPQSDGEQTPQEPDAVFVVSGTGGGDFDAQSVRSLQLPTPFAAQCSRWVAADVDGSGIDDLIGIDQAAICAAAGPVVASTAIVISDGDLEQRETSSIEDPAMFAPEAATLVDVDGDARLDYLVSFRGDLQSADAQGQGIAMFRGAGGGIDFSAAEPVTVPEPGRLVGASPVRTNPDVTRDLVLLAGGALYRSTFDGEADAFDAPVKMLDHPEARLLVSGDLNGDGLDDLAVVYGSQVDILLAVPAAPLGDSADEPAEDEQEEEAQ